MVLFSVPNRHKETPPVLPADGYRGYYENEYGEQLLFHQAKGERAATVWHGDTGYTPHRVEAASVPGLVLDGGERLWIEACWESSTHLRAGDLDRQPRGN
jgi:hypothetical protein